MKKRFSSILFVLSVALLLTACQFAVGNRGSSANQTPTPTVVKVTSTPRPSPTPRPTLAPTATAVPFADTKAAATAYGAALEKGDFATAAGQLSAYGLMIANMTTGDVTAQWKADPDAAKISAFKTLDAKQATPNTVLVHVTYTAGKEATAHDELWPFRNENGTWKYNWANLIDFHTLTVDPQTTNGVTFIPQRLLRFSDHTRLELWGQNHTNDPIIFGQVNETLATFEIGGKAVEAEKTHLALNALRTNNNLALDIKGYYDVYPTRVDIRKWRDYNEKPWFSFTLP